MEIPEDVYGLHAVSHSSDGFVTELGLDYEIFSNNDNPQQGFLEGVTGGTSGAYFMDQSDQVHVNGGYVNHEGRDVMFCPEHKYEGIGQYTVKPINIPRSTRQEPLTLTPPRSVGSDSPMDERGIAIQIEPDSTIDLAKLASLRGNHMLLSNGLEDPMNGSSSCMMHTRCEPEPRRKRRKTESDAMTSGSHMVKIKTEPCDDVFLDSDSTSSEMSPDCTSYQCLKWTEFKKSSWQNMYDENRDIVSMVDFQVDADKGFNFSFADDSFVCQKKNHFQITVTIKAETVPKYIKVKDNLKPIDKFKIHLFGVKVESTNSTIKIEQSQADRSKRPYDPVVVMFPSQEPSRMTIGRLHFSETTSNNMRKKGKPNPDQRYFMLAVALHAHSKNDHQLIHASVSDRIIVRASNPGQFENDVEVVWSRGHTADSVFRVGRVGINTDKPCESLSVHGNVRVTGRILMPSDKRIKENLTEVDSSEQLRNVSKMKLYRYNYSQEYLDTAGLETDPDTGVIAQEVQQVLPDAVTESEDLKLSDGKRIEKFLVVNKERIFMENVGAVKELCKLTDKLETRIDELEKVSKKLQSRRRADTASSCFSALSRSSSLSSTSSTRSTAKESSPSKNKKTDYHGKHYNCSKHNCHQRRQQQVVLEESSWCTPRFMQFVIIILILVMSLSVGAMAALYIMQDSSRPGYRGDSSEAFENGALMTNTTPSPTPTETSRSSLANTTRTEYFSTKAFPKSTIRSTLSSIISTSRSMEEVTTPTDNSTQNATAPNQNPKHDSVPTEGTQRPPKSTTTKPVCYCCSQSEKCSSVPYNLLTNKPVYYEMSNAFPSVNKVSKQVNLRIVERNYRLICDNCGLANETFFIPLSTAIPFQAITIEINSTIDTKVLLCSSTYQLQCPEKSTQPQYDTVLKKDSWKRSHHWRLPSAFYFSSVYRFRVVNKLTNPSSSQVNCSTSTSSSVYPRTFKDYYIHFIRVCKN